MHYSICATIGSVIFLSILLFINVTKDKKKMLKHNIFNILFYVTYALLISEIVSADLFAYTQMTDLAYIFLRIHWLLAFFWMDLLLLFVICFAMRINDNNVKSLFNVKYLKVLLILLTVLKIVYFFIPFSTIDPNNIAFVPGPAAYFGFAYIVLVMILLIIYERKSQYKNKDTFACVFIIVFEGSLVFILQLLISNVAFYGCIIVSIMYGLYATAENPDLDVIDDLKKLKDDIDTSSRVKTDVILSMSHDIRSPMNAIVNYSEGLANLSELNNDQIKEDINNILVSGKNLLNIIGDVLDISSANNDSDNLYSESYQLQTILDDLMNITKSRIGQKQIKLITNVDPSVPSMLKGNSTKLYRIIMNILSNSAKYTDIGRITTDISATKVENTDLIMLHFKISDTGFGIKEEDKCKVFSKFSRLNDATTQNIEGTGLGLINTKKNVESLGGKIWFDSLYGAGTTFYIDIPQKVANDVNNGEQMKNVRLAENLIDCKNYRVLVVDDNMLNINVTTRLLQRYGFIVDYARSSDECITKIKEDNKYNLIFMDIFFNGESGIEILKVLRQLNKVYDIPPIVALTANALSGSRELYLKEGFDEYLAKPIDINELDRVLNLFFKTYM